MPRIRQVGFLMLKIDVQTGLANDMSFKCKGYAEGVQMPGHQNFDLVLGFGLKKIRSLPCEVGTIGKNNITVNRIVNFRDTETVRSEIKENEIG